MCNKKCGMKEHKFNPNLKSLIARFSSKNGPSFFVTIVTLFNVLELVLTFRYLVNQEQDQFYYVKTIWLISIVNITLHENYIG